MHFFPARRSLEVAARSAGPHAFAARPRRVWTAAVVAAVAAAAWPAGSSILAAVGFALAAVAVAGACRTYGPGRRSPWAPLVVVLVLDAAALLIRPAAPTAAAALLAASVGASFVAARRFGRGARLDPGSLTDAAIAGCAMVALTVDVVWVPLVRGGLDLGEALAGVTTLAEVAVLTALAYSLLATGALRLQAVRLFSIGAVINAALSVLWVATGHGLARPGPIMTALHLGANLVMAAGALHRSMRRLGSEVPSTPRLTTVRVTVVGLCGLSPWALLVISNLWTGRPAWPVGLCGLVLGALLVGRLSRALAARDEDQRRDATLRSGLTALLVATDHATIELAVVLAARNLLGDNGASVRLTTSPAGPVVEPFVARLDTGDNGDRDDGSPGPPVARLAAELAPILGTGTERPWMLAVPVPVAAGSAAGQVLLATAAKEPGPELLRAFQTLAGQLGLARERSALAESMHRRHAEHRLAALVENAFDVITILDQHFVVQFLSPSIATVLGHDPATVANTDFLALLEPEEAAAVEAQLRHVAAGTQRSSSRIDCRLRHLDDEWLDVEITATNLLGDPDVNGLVLNIRDVSERRALEQQLIRQAFHDPLTGLANRVLFSDRVEHAMLGTLRGGPEPAVLFIDLDNFKMVNDSLGHPVGDRLLVEIADRLVQSLRPGDTAARVGGDEFAVLLSDAGQFGVEQLRALAGRVFDAIAVPMLLEGAEIAPRASIGIATGSSALTANDLIRNADLAMYLAKGQGGGVAMFESSMHDSARRRLDLQAELSRALERDEFEVYFQPIVALHDDDGPRIPDGLLAQPVVVGMEALVRWNHPQRGLVGPGEFIPLAEETGFIIDLGRWVMTEACRTVAGWARDGLAAKLSLTVNVSARQLQEPSLVDDVAWAIHSTGIDPGWLVIEVTESVVMQDSSASVEWLQALKQLGVRIAIDDFGTGYSSLAYLQMFPIDVMKVDRSFVIGLGGDPKAAELVRAVINLSDSLGMTTLAEGIETVEQLVELQRLGCRLGQGFAFARPMPARKLVEAWQQGGLVFLAPGPRRPGAAGDDRSRPVSRRRG